MSDELKKELRKNIKLIRDNEESFVAWHAKNEVVQIDGVYEFYMGINHHFIRFEFDNEHVADVICWNSEFENWKLTINKGDKQ